MNKKIYLIRHGKIDTENEKRYVGITDLVLDKEGVEQAYLLKNYFSNLPIDQVYTSPLKRCLQTAEIIMTEKQQKVTVVEDLREINMGIWENKPINYIKENYSQAYVERGKDLEFFLLPEGESFHQLANRVMLAFDNIVNKDQENIMIIAHAGVNRVIISKILGDSIGELFHIQQPYGCVNELLFEEETHKWKYKRLL